MSDRDVGMGEMHEFNDDSPEVAAFIGELRNAYATETIAAPTQALTELFTCGLSIEETAPVAGTPRRSHVLAPVNRRRTAAKAIIAGIAIVGASTGLAAADLLPQPVDDTVSKVVPFVESDSADDDTTNPTIDDDDDDRDDDGPSDNSGPGSDSSGSSDDDDNGDDSTVTTIDDDVDEDRSGSGSDDSDDIDDSDVDDSDDEPDDSDDRSGSNSGSG